MDNRIKISHIPVRFLYKTGTYIIEEYPLYLVCKAVGEMPYV